MGHSVAASKNASPLKPTARASTRPSISGSATFMAMSRAPRPRVPSRQAASVPAESTACSTGAPWSPLSGFSAPPTANEVRLTITSGGASARSARSVSAESGSFSEATKTGSGASPSRPSARTRRVTGWRPAPCTSAR